MVLTEQQMECVATRLAERIKFNCPYDDYRVDGYQFETDVDIVLVTGHCIRMDFHYDITADEFGFDRLDSVNNDGETIEVLDTANLITIEKKVQTKMFIERRDKWN